MEGLIEHFREDLKLEQQRLKELAVAFHQTKGRIQYIEHLLSELNPLTLEEFAELIAGEGATAEIVNESE